MPASGSLLHVRVSAVGRVVAAVEGARVVGNAKEVVGGGEEVARGAAEGAGKRGENMYFVLLYITRDPLKIDG